MSQIARVGAGVLYLCAVVAAGQTPVRHAANLTSGCVNRVESSADYFPDKATIEDAATFSVDYRKSYKVVTVKEAYAGGPSAFRTFTAHTLYSGIFETGSCAAIVSRLMLFGPAQWYGTNTVSGRMVRTT